MSIMIPSCNAHVYMKYATKNFAPYAKNATVKNMITINEYNVGMKSLDRAIIVSDTLKTETSPSFNSQVRGPVPVPFLFPAPVPDSGFQLFHTPHVGAHPYDLQHGVCIQSSINLGKVFPRISRIRSPSTQILARVFVYLPPFISQTLDFICRMVLIFILIYFEWRDAVYT